MNTEAFTRIYNESRNGCNGFYHHSLVRYFEYSDGVQELAQEGCYWLLDILATEFCKPLRASGYQVSIVTVAVKNSKARITLTTDDYGPSLKTRIIKYTDLPEGDWKFELVDEGHRFALILISEH